MSPGTFTKLGLAPLVPVADIRISDSLDQNGTAVVDFSGSLNCLGLGWFHGAGAFCAAATDCVNPLGDDALQIALLLL